MKRVADGIYSLRGHFYYRPKKPDGNYTWRALDGRTLKAARTHHRRVLGLDFDEGLTVGEAVQVYQAAGCPDKRRQARAAEYLKAEQGRCSMLLKFWQSAKCSSITSAMVDDYADWRIKHAKKGHGGRAADLDIITLKNALRWVSRRGLLQQNPFERLTISSYRKGKIRHCREVAPKSGAELHDLAANLMDDPRSAVLGWLALITAMIGCRISEMTVLRVDTKEGEPGSITNEILWLRRKKKGANNFFRVHPALRSCLDAFFDWRGKQKKFKASPWWFPGRNGGGPVDKDSLTHALRRVGLLVAGQARTAHGLRSFYVTCRRSEGMSDAQIALETGQISGGREIVRTYGDATPRKVAWLPESGKPAWELYEKYTNGKPASLVSAKKKSRTKANKHAVV